jgi:hypothetical protein
MVAHWRGSHLLEPVGEGLLTDATAKRFVGELLNTRFVSNAAFEQALAAYGERGVVNLMVLLGYWNIRCAQQTLAGSDCAL